MLPLDLRDPDVVRARPCSGSCRHEHARPNRRHPGAPTASAGPTYQTLPIRRLRKPSTSSGTYREGSVFFYPPGSIQEHLVTEHGTDSLDMIRKTKGHHDHTREHSRPAGLQVGGLGDILAVGHAHGTCMRHAPWWHLSWSLAQTHNYGDPWREQRY